ncbi:unnamed protein product, partial [Meganyctiphanes norvegica]
RFGIERYLIPLKFRTDLITDRQHETLFANLDQLVDLCECLVDKLMGQEDDVIGEFIGKTYYELIDDLSSHYQHYLEGLPEADKVLQVKLREMDFKDFLVYPTVPRKKPDITTFLHKPLEHLREVLGLLQQVYNYLPATADNNYLDIVLEKLKTTYHETTSQQKIMEPGPPIPYPGPPGTSPPYSPPMPLRPPLISAADIEERLVFTKYTQ